MNSPMIRRGRKRPLFRLSVALVAFTALIAGRGAQLPTAAFSATVSDPSAASVRVFVECPEPGLGREVTLVGTGFQPGETVTIAVSTIIVVPISPISTDSSGRFVETFLISPSLPPDLYTFSVVGVSDSAETVSTLQCPMPISYVALGDSFSAGQGVPPFFQGTDGPGDFCHRSVN